MLETRGMPDVYWCWLIQDVAAPEVWSTTIRKILSDWKTHSNYESYRVFKSGVTLNKKHGYGPWRLLTVRKFDAFQVVRANRYFIFGSVSKIFQFYGLLNCILGITESHLLSFAWNIFDQSVAKDYWRNHTHHPNYSPGCRWWKLFKVVYTAERDWRC
jgi:hypothetical protein